jgi:NADH:ubiquinone oxidoreductase subunit K
MKKKNPNDDSFPSSESSNIKDSIHNSAISHYVEQTHSLSTFYMIAAGSQILLGLAVVTVSMLGLIQPQWLSTLLIMVASAATMIGLYLLYITVANRNNQNTLLRNAMQRIMQHKN